MSISFQTNKTGAAATVCSTSTIKYNFSVAQDSTVSNATFAMSKGSSTSASCVVAIYNQPNGGGSVVASVTLPASSFSSSSYPDVVFNFPANTTVTANTSYSLTISSSTGCNGANAYSMKPGSFQAVDTVTAQVINTGYAIVAAPAALSTVSATAKRSIGLSATASSNSTTTGTAKRSISLSSASVSVSSLTAALTTNKNYSVSAAATAIAHNDAAAFLTVAFSAAGSAEAHMDAAATSDYAAAATPKARAVLFASTEPYLFVESAVVCEAIANAAAVQNFAVQALATGIAAAIGDMDVQQPAGAAIYIGDNSVGRLYIGPTRITKAYIGLNLLLDQQN